MNNRVSRQEIYAVPTKIHRQLVSIHWNDLTLYFVLWRICEYVFGAHLRACMSVWCGSYGPYADICDVWVIFFAKCCKKVKTSFLYLAFNKPFDFMCLYVCANNCVFLAVCVCFGFLFSSENSVSLPIFMLYTGGMHAYTAKWKCVILCKVMTSSIQTNRYTINCAHTR